MSWSFVNNAACYSPDDYDGSTSLGQTGVLDIGEKYIVSISVNGMSHGHLTVDSFGGVDMLTENGVYQVSGIATIPDLSVTASDTFDGCVDFIYAIQPPVITVLDCYGSVVYTVNNDDLSVYKSNIQVHIPWDLPAGQYVVRVEDSGLGYVSDCFNIGDYECSILLSWTNEDNAYGIDYSTLQQHNNLRVVGKLGQLSGKGDRDIFEFSDGSEKIIYANRKKIFLLTMQEMPEYLHAAIMVGIDHDNFFINGTEYVVQDSDYEPVWRKSSQLAPSTISVKKKDEGLINRNCG